MSDILIRQARVQQAERQRCLQGEKKVIDTEIDRHNNNCTVENKGKKIVVSLTNVPVRDLCLREILPSLGNR